ncbi:MULTISPECIES: YbhB/YbcL family Raf kinase inhibitor-like protein [Pandoraea]|uniref:PBP family phospholipid-binding protein n=1 Tax=Pandoraea communis TaxID=2508297 RepID=A0A5E4RSI5_9BURK|nr:MULTISPECIES: YbhB/YbcL family Raf kinase inhibitor-like protein [Pandoraea]EON14620.1 PBP family phospholipid-binding protein [Pandoraea sp. SD6-2]VVD65731.1 PBP family phospholipid-binding protein [Pandoraea communis]
MKIGKFIFTFFAGLFVVSNAIAGGFAIQSDDIAGGHFDNAQISDGFGCHGGNISPAISWSGEPAGTQSFLVTMYDPDAPTGSGFWHWVVANLPASVHTLDLGAGSEVGRLPKGAMAVRNDTGKAAYLGPCPPEGESHRYIITVAALKVPSLPVDSTATPAVVGFVAHYQELAKATITIQYAR